MKQKLVRINEKNYRGLRQVQDYCKKANKPIPSVPYLVNRAVQDSYPAFISEFGPKELTAA